MRFGEVFVTDKESKLIERKCHTIQEIRAITPQAAARRFIKNTLPGMFLCAETEGMYEPSEIKVHSSKTKKDVYTRQARKYKDDAKKRAKNTEFTILR